MQYKTIDISKLQFILIYAASHPIYLLYNKLLGLF